jgi:hypothetical protein
MFGTPPKNHSAFNEAQPTILKRSQLINHPEASWSSITRTARHSMEKETKRLLQSSSINRMNLKNE